MPFLKAWVAAAWFHNVVGQVDEQLGQASLSCGVVTKDRGEGRATQRLREALPKGFAGACIVTKAVEILVPFR